MSSHSSVHHFMRHPMMYHEAREVRVLWHGEMVSGKWVWGLKGYWIEFLDVQDLIMRCGGGCMSCVQRVGDLIVCSATYCFNDSKARSTGPKTKYPSISCIKRVITATTYKVSPPNPFCVRRWPRKQIYILPSRYENNPLIASYSLDTMQGIISIDNNQSTYIRKQALAGHSYEPFNNFSTCSCST